MRVSWCQPFSHGVGKRNSSNFHFPFSSWEIEKRNSKFNFRSQFSHDFGIPFSISVIYVSFSYDPGKRNSNFHFCFRFPTTLENGIRISFSFQDRHLVRLGSPTGKMSARPVSKWRPWQISSMGSLFVDFVLRKIITIKTFSKTNGNGNWNSIF